VANFIAAITANTAAAWSQVEGLTPTIQAIGVRAYQEASADAYKTVYLSTLAFSGVGIILCFFTPNVDNKLTSDVAITLHEKKTEAIVGAKAVGGDEKV
jgi:hypothetical protein